MEHIVEPITFDISQEAPNIAFDLGVSVSGGGGSDKHFVFVQSASSAKWEITHGLNKYPAVSIVDSAGSTVVGDVQYTSKNTVEITFTAPFSGKAYFN